LRDSLLIHMLLSVVSVLVVAQSSSEVPEGLMNNPVYNTSALPASLYRCETWAVGEKDK